VIQSLTLVLGSRPEAQTEHWIGKYGYDDRLKGYALTAPAGPEQMARARAIIEAACSPMSGVELVQELTKLRLAVVMLLSTRRCLSPTPVAQRPPTLRRPP
jgi:hypothetical protein